MTQPRTLPHTGQGKVQHGSTSVWQTGHFPPGHWGSHTGIPSTRTRARDAEASAQGLIYQRDRSRRQGLPQISAGLKMQRTETLRHSCLVWPPSGMPNRPQCTLGPRRLYAGTSHGRTWGLPREMLPLREREMGETEEGERQKEGRKTQTRKGLDKEVRLLEHIQDRHNGPMCLLLQGGHLRRAMLREAQGTQG